MKRMVFGESVQGASHKRVDKECQDSFKKLEYDDGTVIMAIADGHGSKACPYSKSGSSIAVNVFCKVMDEFHASYAECSGARSLANRARSVSNITPA